MSSLAHRCAKFLNEVWKYIFFNLGFYFSFQQSRCLQLSSLCLSAVGLWRYPHLLPLYRVMPSPGPCAQPERDSKPVGPTGTGMRESTLPALRVHPRPLAFSGAACWPEFPDAVWTGWEPPQHVSCSEYLSAAGISQLPVPPLAHVIILVNRHHLVGI